jgi:hypothetical protein
MGGWSDRFTVTDNACPVKTLIPESPDDFAGSVDDVWTKSTDLPGPAAAVRRAEAKATAEQPHRAHIGVRERGAQTGNARIARSVAISRGGG